MFTRFCFFALCFVSFSTAAELYKWVDENGVVHYSEEKPPHLQEVESLQLNGTKNFDTIASKPIAKTPDLATRHIIIRAESDFWSTELLRKQSVRYFFGGDCVSPTRSSLQEMLDLHKSLIPQFPYLFNSMKSPIQKLGYPVGTSFKRPLQSSVARHDQALVLTPKVINLDYHVCAKNLKYAKNKDKGITLGYLPEQFRASHFKHRRVELEVKWIISDGQSGEVLYTSLTQGKANHWHKASHKHSMGTIKSALENATNQLFSDKAFVRLLPAKIRKAKTLPKIEKEEGLLDSLSKTFSQFSRKKSDFANALSHSQTLKFMLTEYYFSEGAWPKSIHALGLSDEDVYQKDLIDSVDIDYNGTIVIQLNAHRFEKGAAILLIPEETMGGSQINWQCKSNLDTSYYNDYCSPI